MTTRNKPGGRLLSLAAALAVGLLGPTAPTHADSASINPNQEASLTLHKCAQPSAPGAPANGREQTGIGCTPIDGVTFALYKVDDIDLVTPGGWEAVKGLTAPETGTIIGGHTSAEVLAITTTGGGIANWQDFDLGLYLTIETDTGSPDTKVVLGSKSSLVALPYYADGNQWDHNVHAYPKNSVAGIEKTVGDSIVRAKYSGDDVKWTITTDIPRGGQGTEITSYVITDTLPAGLALNNSQATLGIEDGINFVNNDDYSCTGNLTCTFTPDGIARLKANGGQKVVLTLVTDVTGVSQAASGVFTNKAKVTISGTDSVGESATTAWEQLTVYEYDGSNGGFLGGTKFESYTSEACSDQDIVLAELITGPGGKVLFPVVRPGTYCLVEAEAPVGYVGTETQQVTVEAGVTETLTQSISAGKNCKPVANTKQAVPQLSLTGGIGQVALAAGDIGLLVIGGAVMVIGHAAARRKQAWEGHR